MLIRLILAAIFCVVLLGVTDVSAQDATTQENATTQQDGAAPKDATTPKEGKKQKKPSICKGLSQTDCTAKAECLWAKKKSRCKEKSSES
jgi:hypothetical protein